MNCWQQISIFLQRRNTYSWNSIEVRGYSTLINKNNGFLSNAEYNAQYINQDYRNVEITKVQRSDYSLFTGHSASRSTNPIVSQTLSVDTFNDGIVDKTVSIPVSSSTAYSLKEFNENASKARII